MPISQIRDCLYYPFSDEPILKGYWPVKSFSSPSFLFPTDSLDNKWHLFLSSNLGLHHFVSTSGIEYEPMQLTDLNVIDPFVFCDKGVYYLIYVSSKDNVKSLHGKKKITFLKTNSKSSVLIRSSEDLKKWSKPRVIFYSDEHFLSCPRMVKEENDSYRLYYCYDFLEVNKENVPRFTSFATSDNLLSPFTSNRTYPIIQSKGNSKYRNIASGRISIIKGEYNYFGLSTQVFYDKDTNKFNSVIRESFSNDGIVWTFRNIIALEEDNIISSASIRYKFDEAIWYCYYTVKNNVYLILAKNKSMKDDFIFN